MKFTPASLACAMMAFASRSSARPPNIIVPRQIRETSSPLLPSRSYNMPLNLSGGDGVEAGAQRGGADDEFLCVGRQPPSAHRIASRVVGSDEYLRAVF